MRMLSMKLVANVRLLVNQHARHPVLSAIRAARSKVIKSNFEVGF